MAPSSSRSNACKTATALVPSRLRTLGCKPSAPLPLEAEGGEFSPGRGLSAVNARSPWGVHCT
eukprot:12902707-Prorocentrum_lima.AAC.1